ncbi:FecCD family ABC transporter permease [Thermoflavimicrobium dichotomicum]|uniref:Iron complex transport system permease protein n=1 Tax=Thermoflavimicrobium dichotomicum TaxID=46223 RepID=A0A1I3RME6_9BACL|nr:iron ABC transporter permease [Thermoflavimicrobium dichotomicum]SFJ46427.1 iron complex transport system permease protein [Thermoflavimicrobium dichotomicum]
MKVYRFVWWSGGLFLCFLFSIGATVTLGSAQIDMGTVWKIIFSHLWYGDHLPPDIDVSSNAIVWQLRLPRVILAAVVGASLAIAGVIFQGLLKNPLADPYVLGISSGAATGAVLAILTGWGSLWLGKWTVPVYAFSGACLALFLVLRIADQRLRTESLVLSGVVTQAFFGALLTLALSLSEKEFQRIQFWLMGSFVLRDWDHVWILLPVMGLGSLCAWWFSRELNLLVLGDRSAAHLGMDVTKVRFFLLMLASLVTAVAVSVSGTIGFVGLVIPHMMRMLTGADHYTLIPLSALAGAIFMVWGDCAARLILDPRELPVGVITAFIGAPFFAMLLKKQQKG